MAEAAENAIDIALKVALALTSVDADYFVGGSLASSLQGEPRATNDIDFVIALPVGKVGAYRGFQTAVDVVGYNYKPTRYIPFHQNNRTMPTLSSESASAISCIVLTAESDGLGRAKLSLASVG